MWLLVVQAPAKHNESVLTSFTVFPNPAVDNINIHLSLTEAKKVVIKLYNSLGAEVQTAIEMNASVGDNEYKINIENLPEGIYFVRINVDGTSASTRRVIVLK